MRDDRSLANRPSARGAARVAAGFIAGFLAVLVFHQLMLGLLHVAGIAPDAPYAMQPTAPLGVPRVFSLAFWGGLWGVALAVVLSRIAGRPGYWLTALLFGALGPSMVNWLVVLPLKGQPLGGGWHLAGIVTALLVNAAWGIGAAVILSRAPTRRRPGGAGATARA